MAVFKNQQEQVSSLVTKGILGNGYSVKVNKSVNSVVTIHVKSVKHDDAPEITITIKEK